MENEIKNMTLMIHAIQGLIKGLHLNFNIVTVIPAEKMMEMADSLMGIKKFCW